MTKQGNTLNLRRASSMSSKIEDIMEHAHVSNNVKGWGLAVDIATCQEGNANKLSLKYCFCKHEFQEGISWKTPRVRATGSMDNMIISLVSCSLLNVGTHAQRTAFQCAPGPESSAEEPPMKIMSISARSLLSLCLSQGLSRFPD